MNKRIFFFKKVRINKKGGATDLKLDIFSNILRARSVYTDFLNIDERVKKRKINIIKRVDDFANSSSKSKIFKKKTRINKKSNNANSKSDTLSNKI